MDKDRHERFRALIAWIDQHGLASRILLAQTLLIAMACIYLLVYHTGGIKFVYSHSMYIPILLAGFLFRMAGGLLAGLVGGLILGPFMPISVATGEAQETLNWLYRTGFFMLIGALAGAASEGTRAYLRQEKWLAQHDPGTGLPNRSALLERLESKPLHKQIGSPFCLLVIALDNAMELKSTFGYAVIDSAIRQLAARLEKSADAGDIYHTETAQLALLLRHCSPNLDGLFAELTDACREPILYNDIPIHIDTRIGHVAFSRIGERPETYLQQAEAALTVAYKTSQDNVGYSPAIVTFTEENLSILGELKNALANRQLSLHYQPKITLADGRVCGSEALMRWQHPTRGNIPPGVFIPRAEQSTLIQPVTHFALSQALEQIVRWRQAGMPAAVAVNIAPQNLVQPRFAESILALLQEHGLNGDCLELEVTEHSLMLDMDHAITELTRLADAGIGIAIDDFGTGYCSLQYLHRLPATVLKIDQTFIRRLPADQDAIHIVDAAVTLAHKLGMQALAEGVETTEVYNLLCHIGCDIAQGYLMGRPMPANDFAHWYQQGNGCYSHASA